LSLSSNKDFLVLRDTIFAWASVSCNHTTRIAVIGCISQLVEFGFFFTFGQWLFQLAAWFHGFETSKDGLL
jgi:hypothetical protein